MENKPIRVFIVDDQPAIRRGLRDIILEDDNIKVVGEASNGQEVLDNLSHIDCDVMLLDISMPVKGGLDILKPVKQEKPMMAILMLSIHPAEYYAETCIKAGASGYLVKESAPDELIDAIYSSTSRVPPRNCQNGREG
jgi:two-component system, NarL family, invasion response regulator UvrY